MSKGSNYGNVTAGLKGKSARVRRPQKPKEKKLTVMIEPTTADIIARLRKALAKSPQQGD